MTSFLKLLVITLLIGASLQVQAEEAKLMQTFSENIAAPEFQFSDGKRQIGLSSFKGKYVLVNFWATWCSPCVKEMPSLNRLAGHLEKNGVVVIAISQDEGGPPQVRPFVEKLKLNKIQILYDQDKKGFRDYALRGLPTSVLISPQGKLLARLEGGAAWDEGALNDQVIKLTNVKK